MPDKNKSIINVAQYKESKRQELIFAQKEWKAFFGQAVMELANSFPEPMNNYPTSDLNDADRKKRVMNSGICLGRSLCLLWRSCD